MRNENSVILAGPVTGVRNKIFGNYGFLNLEVAGVRVTVTMNQDEFGLVQQGEAAKSAVIWSGFFESRQDKKDPAKFWENIAVRAKSIVFTQHDTAPLNHGLVVGKVQRADGPWAIIGCSYHIPKKNEWAERQVRVLFEEPYVAPEQSVMLVGTVQHMYGELDCLHLKVSMGQLL